MKDKLIIDYTDNLAKFIADGCKNGMLSKKDVVEILNRLITFIKYEIPKEG